MSTHIHIRDPYNVSGRLYTQTNSSTPVTNTTTETSLLDGGVGTLTVPANGFQVGDSFHAILTGHISSVNNNQLHIRIKANSILLSDTGQIIMSGSTNKHWKLEVYFTVRTIGASGVASIVTGGTFMYTKDASNSFEGSNFSTETFTGFDTTISNTLSVTAQWDTASTGNSIYSELFTLNKTY
jgi:flagellar hook-basal body complex protein FliE